MNDPELIRHISHTTGLSESEATRVVDDVLTYYREPVEAFIRRRHTKLQTYGVRNNAAFDQIASELPTRLVAAPHLSTRQIRRVIYG